MIGNRSSAFGNRFIGNRFIGYRLSAIGLPTPIPTNTPNAITPIITSIEPASRRAHAVNTTSDPMMCDAKRA